jgi:Ca-activated chloride channel family protein
MQEQLFHWANQQAAQYDARFTEPWALLLLWAIPFCVLIAFLARASRWYVRILQLLPRSAWIIALTVAALLPVREHRKDALEVVVVKDVSLSIDEGRLARANSLIQSLTATKSNTDTTLIPKITTLSFSEKVDSTGGTNVGSQEESNLEAAIQAARALFTPGRDHRIVLLSDGRATKGDALAAAKKAGEEKSPIFVFPLGAGDQPEVFVKGISLPDKARSKDDFHAEVFLESAIAEGASVKLLVRPAGSTKKPQPLNTQKVTLTRGKMTVDFTAKIEEPGIYEIKTEVKAAEGGDTFSVNNNASGFLTVEDLPKVLLVRRPGEPETPLDQTLKAVATRYHVDTSDAMPQSLSELGQYDLILFNDPKTAKFSDEENKILTTYVTDLGGGLILAMGDNAKDIAEPPEDTPIEELLPLGFKRIKQKEEVPLAVVFVIDKSASMDRDRKFEMAISSVKQAATHLKDDADVSIILFDDLPYTQLALTKASEREKIENSLNSLGVGGGTDLYPALKAAYAEIKKSEAKIKHIIVLSDGESLSRYEQNSDTVDRIVQNKITITTIGLSADSDPVHLLQLAKMGGGTFYYTEDPSKLPDIFAKETQTTTETTVKTAEYKATVQAPADAVDGIDWGSAPNIKGYITSEPKPTSEIILVATSASPAAGTQAKKDPLLARWYRGLGRVAVFTSDAGNAWAAPWTSWEGYARFWEQLTRTTLRGRKPATLLLRRRVEPNGIATVELETRGKGGLPDENAKVALECLDGLGNKIPLELTKGGRAITTATFQLPAPGSYVLKASREGGEAEVATVIGDLFYQTSPELSHPGDELDTLAEIAKASNGAVFQDGPSLSAAVFAEGSKTVKTYEELWKPFMWLALAIFLVDVLFRRVA